MDTTAKLALPYLLPQQAQKHVTHNEAIRMLDALVHLSIKGRDESDPPTTPAEGDRYALSGAPTGVWIGNANRIAAFQDGAWAFFEPRIGWIAWDEDAEETLVWDGTGWQPAMSVPPTLSGLAGVGVNTAPDATSKLAVKSDAVLLSHDDVTPGSGDMRQVLNKAASANTASMLFQTGFSGRAEFGLTGDDDWHVKVSPDGSSWKEALVADSNSGEIAVQGLKAIQANYARASSIIFTPGGDGVVSIYRVDTRSGENPRTATIAGISGDEITLTDTVANTIFSTYMTGVSCARIWNTTQSAWVEAYISSNVIRVTNAADLSGWQAGDTIQIGDPLTITPNRCITLDISPMLTNLFGQPFRQTGIVVKAAIVAGSATQGDAIGLTPTGAGGSFATAAAHGAGDGSTLIPCTDLSPISNSNLVRVRESLAATAGIRLMSSMAVLG